jgi:SAM-dependent methyltransferase
LDINEATLWQNHRRKKILKYIDTPGGAGLEIGAGYMPLFPKRMGFNVKTLDYVSQEDLRQKYTNADVNISGLEEVNFVWNGEPYAEVTRGEHFNWIVASHVIEHVPDFIGFINNCASILKERGVLALYVPDRRYNLDYFRSTSSLGSIIDAHLYKRTRPSPGNILDALFLETTPYRTSNNPWDRDLAFLDTPNNKVYAGMTDIMADGYFDIHVWVFTPSHFRMIIEDLYACGAIKLREKVFCPSESNEFCVILSKDGSGPGLSRLELAREIVRERHVNRLKAGRGTSFRKNVLPEICKFSALKKLYAQAKRNKILRKLFHKKPLES